MHREFGGRSVIVLNEGPHDAIGVTLGLSAPYEQHDYLFLPDAVGSHIGNLSAGQSREVWLNLYAIGLLRYEITWVDGHGENNQEGVVPGSDVGYLA
jgi:hypothetical protein